MKPESPVGSSVDSSVLCSISQVSGMHTINNYYLLQKFV